MVFSIMKNIDSLPVRHLNIKRFGKAKRNKMTNRNLAARDKTRKKSEAKQNEKLDQVVKKMKTVQVSTSFSKKPMDPNSLITVGLCDPMSLYHCPNPDLKIQQVIDDNQFYKPFLSRALEDWDLEMTDLTDKMMLVPEVEPTTTSVRDWHRLVSANNVVQCPLILYFVKSGKSRDDVVGKLAEIKNVHQKLQDDLLQSHSELEECLETQKILRVQLAVPGLSSS